ncbi:histidine kinase [Flavivirga abyssicola]|uniref:sensor histidine kinase n=1 Tax=Flavivirga abyssicola TaxID=3063533 RepID=UPI0026E001EC|nr:histidine kinase [Flavivirga sp. MEBiC07777]WVK14280.1 histidine kinase [Flavivirga sp. MEBiC07777]
MIKRVKPYLDLKLIGILSLFYFIFVVIYASKNAYLRIYSKRQVDWGEFIFANLLDWAIIVIFMMFIAFTTKLLMQKKTKLVYIISIHLFFSFFIGAFTIGLSQIVEQLKSPWPMKENSIASLFTSYIRLIDLHFLIYMSLVTMIYMYYYFQKIQESKIQTIKLQDQLSKTHLKFLQTQMHPHFLFNTLNGIHSLMDINIAKSKSMVVDLSDLLRNVLEKKDQNLIELQEELEILKKYIHIKKARFSDQLNIHLNIEEGLENVLVPNMLLQPIVENSTKHGYDKEHLSLDITINIFRKNDKLIVKIKNNGKELKDKLSVLLKKGTGLNNIKERLDSLYNNNYKLKIYNKSNSVITEVNIPIKLSISQIEKGF